MYLLPSLSPDAPAALSPTAEGNQQATINSDGEDSQDEDLSDSEAEDEISGGDAAAASEAAGVPAAEAPALARSTEAGWSDNDGDGATGAAVGPAMSAGSKRYSDGTTKQ